MRQRPRRSERLARSTPLAGLMMAAACVHGSPASIDARTLRAVDAHVAKVYGSAIGTRFALTGDSVVVERAAEATNRNFGGLAAAREESEAFAALGLLASEDGSAPPPGEPRAAYDPISDQVVAVSDTPHRCARSRGRAADCAALAHAVAEAAAWRVLRRSVGAAARETADAELARFAVAEGAAAIAAGGTSELEPPAPSRTGARSAFVRALLIDAVRAGAMRALGARRADGTLSTWLSDLPTETWSLLGSDEGRDHALPRPASPDLVVIRGFRLVREDSLGALAIQTLLAESHDADAATLGVAWRGDRVWLFDGAGRPAALWLTRWRTVADASAFEGALLRLSAANGAVLRTRRRDVLVAAEAGLPSDLAEATLKDLEAVLSRQYALVGTSPATEACDPRAAPQAVVMSR